MLSNNGWRLVLHGGLLADLVIWNICNWAALAAFASHYSAQPLNLFAHGRRPYLIGVVTARVRGIFAVGQGSQCRIHSGRTVRFVPNGQKPHLSYLQKTGHFLTSGVAEHGRFSYK
jgi:hypothetical protein